MIGLTFSRLLVLLTLSVYTAFAAVPEAPVNQAAPCLKTDAVKRVQADFVHPVYFCGWYRSNSLAAAFVNDLTVAELQKACACITSGTKFQGQAVGKPSSAPCSSLYNKALKAEVHQPAKFCSAWLLKPSRTSSPFKSISNPKDIYNACNCGKAASTSSKQVSAASRASTSAPMVPSAAVNTTGAANMTGAATTSAVVTNTTTSRPTTTASPTSTASSCSSVPSGPYYIKVNSPDLAAVNNSYFLTRYTDLDVIRTGPQSFVPGEQARAFYYDACNNTMYLNDTGTPRYLITGTRNLYEAPFGIANASLVSGHQYNLVNCTIDLTTMGITMRQVRTTTKSTTSLSMVEIQYVAGHYNPFFAYGDGSPLTLTAIPVGQYNPPAPAACSVADSGPYYLTVSNTGSVLLENKTLGYITDGSSDGSSYVGSQQLVIDSGAATDVDAAPLNYNHCGQYFYASNSSSNSTQYLSSSLLAGSGLDFPELCNNDYSCAFVQCALNATSLAVNCTLTDDYGRSIIGMALSSQRYLTWSTTSKIAITAKPVLSL